MATAAIVRPVPLPPELTARRNPEAEQEEIRRFRKDFGLSRPKLGSLLHSDQSTIYRWETGEREVPYTVLLLLRCWREAWDRQQADAAAAATTTKRRRK